MSATPPPMAGVVLCGGGSRRMGDDKALLEVDGGPLVLRVAALLAEAAEPVLLAPGTAGRLGNLGFEEVDDAEPSRGPLGGLVAALRASPHPLLAAVAVDMPFASPAVLRLLAAAAGGSDAVVPVTDRGPQPLHAIYARTALPAMERALDEGRLAMRDVLGDLRVLTVPRQGWIAADPGARFAANVNRPEDLDALR